MRIYNAEWHPLWCLVVCLSLHVLANASEPETVSPVELPPANAAHKQGLRLADFEQLALNRNPTLAQAAAQVGISRGKALGAGLYLNPTIGYVNDQVGAQNTAGELQGGFVEQEFVTGGKLQLSRSKYIQESREAQIQVSAQRYRVVFGVRRAFYEALAQQELVKIERELTGNAEEAVTTVKELINVGQANQTDLLRAQLELQRARVALRVAHQRLLGDWEALTAVAAVPDMELQSLVGELEIKEKCVIKRELALQDLLGNSPELAFARAEVVRDQIAVARERVEPIPNVNVRAETGYNFESRDTVAGLSVGVRVPLFDKNQGTILQARSELARAQAEVRRVELSLRRKFGETFADYESARLSAKNIREELIPIAERSYALNQESFKRRRSAWPQVLEAQQDYYRVRHDYVEALVQLRRAESRIMSFFLEDGLSQPQEPTPQGHRESTPRPR